MRSALAAGVLTALVLTGCSTGEETPAQTPGAGSAAGSDSAAGTSSPAEPTSDSPGSAGSEDESEAIEIEIEGDHVEPRGRRVEVSAGEPILLKVESDRPAELHVHSSPEQVLEVKKGESTLSLTIDTPGIVEVEEHETGLVTLQLEVR